MDYVVSADICDNLETVWAVNAINAVNLACWEGRVVNQCYKDVGFFVEKCNI